MARLILLAALLLAGPAAHAAAALPYLISFAANAGAYYVAAALIVAYAYNQRRTAKKLARQQRDAYNDALKDRNVTVISGSPPAQYIYGRATVGPALSDTLTSGDRDQFKHVVMVWASHECDGIEDFQVNGQSVGPLDSQGWVTSGKWLSQRTVDYSESVEFDGAGVATISRTGASLVAVYRYVGIDEGVAEFTIYPGATLSGTTVSGGPAGSAGLVAYKVVQGTPRLRVRHHLGAPGQQVDAVLNGLFPTVWTTAFRGQGICYSVATFDLDEVEFQSGVPPCTATVRGMKVLDPRTGSIAWSQNPALCTRDYLCAEYGKGTLPELVLGTAEAANDCDELISFGRRAGLAARYTCNGSWTSDDDTDATLEALAKSMAGVVAPGGVWRIAAGAYKPPVMELTAADAAGSIEVIEAPGAKDAANGLRGQFYDPLQYNQTVDYEPYSSTAYVEEDGGEVWNTLNLPFTDSQRRCRTIAAVEVEQGRAKQLLWRGKHRCLVLRINDRVRVTLPEMGIEGETFRVVRREFDAAGNHVALTLAGDRPEYYAAVDAADADAVPIDDEYIGLVEVLTATAVGNSVQLSYLAASNVYVVAGGSLVIQMRRADVDTWSDKPSAAGSSTSTTLLGVAAGAHVIRAAWRTGAGAQGDWSYIPVEV